MRKRKQKKSFNKYIIITLLITGLIYWLLFSKSFLIKNLNVYQNNQQIESEEINKFKPLILNQNYFLLDTKNLLAQIIKFQKSGEKISVKKKFPSTVEIYTQQPSILANVKNKNKDQKFNLLSNGQIKKQKFPKSNLITLNITDKENLQEDAQILNRDQIKYIRDSYNYFKKELNIQFKEINVLLKPKEIHFILNNSTEIWIDTTINFEEQINKLKNASPKIDLKNQKYEYIDLRIQSFEETTQKIIYKEV